MKTLLISVTCITLLAACKNDVPAPETTAPSMEAPASTTMETPPATVPPATVSTEPTVPATTTPASTPMPATAPEAGTASSGSSVAGAAQGSGGGMYVVERGDTLWSIAEKNGINHGDLATWNNVSDPRELRVGQELMLSAP